MRRAINLGACGYVLKDSPVRALYQAVRIGLSDGIYVSPELGARIFTSESPERRLTPRQLTIVHAIERGLKSKAIAHEMGISVRTVDAHRRAIMKRLQVRGIIELVNCARELHLVSGNARRA